MVLGTGRKRKAYVNIRGNSMHRQWWRPDLQYAPPVTRRNTGSVVKYGVMSYSEEVARFSYGTCREVPGICQHPVPMYMLLHIIGHVYSFTQSPKDNVFPGLQRSTSSAYESASLWHALIRNHTTFLVWAPSIVWRCFGTVRLCDALFMKILPILWC